MRTGILVLMVAVSAAIGLVSATLSSPIPIAAQSKTYAYITVRNSIRR